MWPAGYADPSTGQFRAAVESADKLHRHRSPKDHLELRHQMSDSFTQVCEHFIAPYFLKRSPRTQASLTRRGLIK